MLPSSAERSLPPQPSGSAHRRGRRALPGLCQAAPLFAPLLALALFAAPRVASAQEPQRPAVLVLEDLLGEDFKAAKRARLELAQIGAKAVPAILEARAAEGRTRHQLRTLDTALREIVDVLAETLSEGMNVPLERAASQGALGGGAGVIDPDRVEDALPDVTLETLGDLGSISGEQPTEAQPKRRRGLRARAALRLLGPAITGPLLRVPPLRERGPAQVIARLAYEIYQRERASAAKAGNPSERAAFAKAYRGLVDLAAPVVAAGVRDPDATVRAAFQAIRDEALETSLDQLAGSPAERARAEETLFRLGNLAKLSLEAVRDGRDPKRVSAHLKATAVRLLRRMRFGLSPELIRRLGHSLEGYDDLPYRERRATVFEIGRLGGASAIPCLRAILLTEESLGVRMAAAIGLVRQQDPMGADWFARNGSDLPRLGLSKSELSAIHMDMGLKHLTQARFANAEREFKKSVEAEPRNEVAWYNLACTYSRWSKLDAAIDALRKAVEFGFDDVKHMRKDPDLDNLRDDPRFKAILEGIERSRSQGEPPE